MDNLFLRAGRIPRAEPKAPGGRPAYLPLTLFKILVLQSLCGLSDEQAQFQILDRRSFQHFLGLTEADPIPDQNTLRESREKLTRAELFSERFAAFNTRLTQQRFIARKGQIIDASFVEVPRQRNRREDNATIKRGDVPAVGRRMRNDRPTRIWTSVGRKKTSRPTTPTRITSWRIWRANSSCARK